MNKNILHMQNDSMAFIDEICVMDQIFSIENKVEQDTQVHITNVSHWDSSQAFQNYMSRVLFLPTTSLPWNYSYTYSIPIADRQQVLKKIGINTHRLQSTMCLLLQSSTIAIINIVNFLVNNNLKRLCILQPAYFSVRPCCSMLSLNYGIEYISFENNNPKIPVNKIIEGGYDCVWITSPIYCTGRYYNEAQYNDIMLLKKAGLIIVFDESLALPGKEFCRSIPFDKNTFAIYSPHKSISINGLKFAAVVGDKGYADFFEHWVDVFSGALASSNCDAIYHYISSNYLQECFPAYNEYINKTKEAIYETIKQFPFASILPNSEGHYISIFTSLRYQDTITSHDFFVDLMHKSFASFLPGTINGFSTTGNLCFRVNLTGDIFETPCAVGRILSYLRDRFY